MKFRFCGDLDCPDWVLAEIATLSRISSVKMKLLSNQVVNGILGTPIDYEKVSKLTADAKLENSDVKATIATISFILTSSAKHGIDEESLSNELQQLGLPKESAAALCKIFSEKFSLLQKKLRNDFLKLTEIKNINWQVDHILSSSCLSDVNNPSVKISFEVTENEATNLHSINMSSSKFQTLLHELKQACAAMEEITPPS
ncbi:COMM domain-containing protein 4-like [Argiope bruennichi]|uniref:COMM domain-containing protein 4 n=1 Tax=Argiope bruennichi TaxID=94029 RepID=A0A8T0F4V1_ARGBR|nr:COMM domain-containing protein 4-like [Argiope bruennichi]KAF8784429.1 COMM domain-containing protein 4 [Argiope bruennichi]